MPAIAAAPGDAAAGPARLVIPEDTVDLGLLIRGEVHHAKFAIRNEGGRPLVIREARPGCKCTVTAFDERIAPGEVGWVEATIDTHSLWGKVSRYVTLYTNAPASPTARLQIDAIVVGSVELLPTDRVQLTNRSARQARALMLVRQDRTEEGTLELTDLTVSTPWLAVQATRLEEKRPASDGIPVGRPGDYVIEVALEGQAPAGRSEVAFTFRTGLEREPQVRIPVAVKWEPAVELSSDTIELAGDEGTTLLVGIRDGFDPRALAVRAEPTALETRLEPSGARHYKLHVAWNGAPGEGSITFAIGDETYRVPVVKR